MNSSNKNNFRLLPFNPKSWHEVCQQHGKIDGNNGIIWGSKIKFKLVPLNN